MTVLYSHPILATIALAGLLAITNDGAAKSEARLSPDQVVTNCYKQSSTHHIAKCIYSETEVASKEMNATFLKLKSEDKREWGPYSGYDPRPDLDAAQQAWYRWMELECEIHANLTRGSVGNIIQPACELRLIRARQEDLARLAQRDTRLDLGP